MTRNYHDGEVYTQAEIDAPYDDIETFLNVTKINDDNIQNNGITGSLKLLTGSVSTGKIADQAITTSKLADEAVTAAKILDNTITETQMAPLSIGTPELIDLSVTTAKLAAAVLAAINPAGAITAYGGTTAPTGWLPCDGASVLRTDFAALFTAIGTAYGTADVNHFNVPDFRARFLRGSDTFGSGAATRDPDRTSRTAMNTGGATASNVGSIQAAAFASHNHTGTVNISGDINTSPPYNTFSTGGGPNDNFSTNTTSPTVSATSVMNIASTGGNETRPINAYVNFIIKT